VHSQLGRHRGLDRGGRGEEVVREILRGDEVGEKTHWERVGGFWLMTGWVTPLLKVMTSRKYEEGRKSSAHQVEGIQDERKEKLRAGDFQSIKRRHASLAPSNGILG